MTLQTSGAISLNHVNVELKKSATAKISLNDAAVRKMLGKTSGTISLQNAYGKSHEVRFVNTAARTSVSIFTLMGSPTAVADYVFENKAEIKASTASYALRTGVFPSGSTLTIINSSYIRGSGGAGSSALNVSGGAGGNAIYLDMACRIDNTNGYILAGGGGGGAAERRASLNTSYFVLAGGGGGAGSVGGAAGTSTHLGTGDQSASYTTPAKPGTSSAGGAGGTMGFTYSNTMDDVAYGGAGGTNGAAGAVGSTANLRESSYKNTPTLGVAGAAGRAINRNGKTLTQVAGFNTTRVKGAYN